MTKVGINGFGRIGRMVFRAWIQNLNTHSDIEIVSVNNPLKSGQTLEHFLHLLEYDSVHGKLKADIKMTSKGFSVNGKEVAFYSQMDPSNIPWGNESVEVVVDSTGVFKDKTTLGKHLHSGVKKVMMSAPGDTDKTLVLGVNTHEYDKQNHHVVSNASCTTNCLAPIVKIMDEKFGVEKGLMNTCHSYTMDQMLCDNLHEDLRRARAAALSIIPTKTGAAKAVAEVLPHLKGKLDGFALRVPTPDVSVVDITFILKKNTTKEEINSVLEEASKGDLKGILSVSKKELVSIDFVGDTHSSIVDAKYTLVMDGNMVKILSWYDNEFGYSCRVLDLVKILL